MDLSAELSSPALFLLAQAGLTTALAAHTCKSPSVTTISASVAIVTSGPVSVTLSGADVSQCSLSLSLCTRVLLDAQCMPALGRSWHDAQFGPDSTASEWSRISAQVNDALALLLT